MGASFQAKGPGRGIHRSRAVPYWPALAKMVTGPGQTPSRCRRSAPVGSTAWKWWWPPARWQPCMTPAEATERPERLARCSVAFPSGLELIEVEAAMIERADLALVDPAYVDAIERFCRLGGGARHGHLCLERYLGRGHDCSRWGQGSGRGVGGSGRCHRLCPLPPPGHHALSSRAMGLHVFNNVAVVAAWLRSRNKRVAILDWDVHHGNRTQPDDRRPWHPLCIHTSGRLLSV